MSDGNAAREKDSPTGEDDEPLHRLLGMIVQEVSLVDRAANKRKFLVIKRQQASAVRKEDDPAISPAESQANTFGAPTGSNAATDTSSGGPSAMQAQVKDALLQALTSAGEKVMAAANAAKDSPVTDDPQQPMVPSVITAAVRDAADMLKQIADQFGGAPSAATGDSATKAQGASAMGGQPTTTVAKVGRKMKKERLERYRKALDIFAGILKELSDENRAKRRLGKAATPPAAAAPPAAGARAAAPPAAAVPPGHMVISKAMGEQFLGAAQAALAAAQKSQKDLAAANARIAQLEKAAGSSNALPLERKTSEAPKDVVWPLDMNQPISPETVKSGQSFYNNTGR